MISPSSILGRAIILVALPSMVLIGLLAALVVAQDRQADAQRLSLHTKAVLEDAQQLLGHLVDAQSVLRGFIITRDRALLARYHEARERLPVTLAELQTLTHDNPVQHGRAIAFSQQVATMLAHYQSVLAAVDAGTLTLAAERVSVLRGKAMMDDLRDAVRAFRTEEQRLDDLRNDALGAAQARLLAVVVGGTGAALFTVVALGWWFHRGISRRVRLLTDTALALSTGNAATPEVVTDELSAVDNALRSMAAALDSRQRAAVGALADAVSLFSAAGSQRAVLDVAADRALALSGAAASVCTLEGEPAGTQSIAAAAVADGHASSAPAPGTPFSWDAARRVIDTGRPLRLSATERQGQTQSREVERVLGPGEWIGAPLIDEHRTSIGVLQVASGPGRSFRSDDVDVVGMLAQAASVALALQQSRHRLEAANADLGLTSRENELFIYSVSHDLRSPLVNLEGFSRELTSAGERLTGLLQAPGVPEETRASARRILDEDVSQSLHFIRVAVGRLAAIIDGLLRLSRAGRVEYRIQPLALDRIAQRVVDAMHSTLAASGGSVAVGPLPRVLGDPLAVEQLFANLIGNAVAYGRPDQPPRVEVAREDGKAGGPGYTVVRVSDNGLGIPESQLEKVFQPLQRLHPGVGRGEGMGLAIVKRIVERHDGRVWVESTIGSGSTFYVELPTDTSGAPADAA